jgi:asparagine synthase (glutamine-hydrolysing)
MCGFAGVVVWDERYRVDRQTLLRMSARLAHRGPDGQGLTLSEDGKVDADRPQVGLVHRRLAVIDPDPRADQPFRLGHGSGGQDAVLVFNGEIYNYRDLRRQLEPLLPGPSWQTQCDTEVLLAAWRAWGERCVDHFNGMFAFAVWDPQDNALFLARDRMGEKPLYYAVAPDPSIDAVHAPCHAIAFASELAALREVPWVDCAIDLPALHNYLMFGYVPGEMTIHTGARKVRPGQWLRISPQQRARHRYFNAGGHFYGSRPLDETLPQRTRRLVDEAVRRRLVADVPVGCLLSGGIDSSVVAASMVRVAGAQVRTFSIGFDDPRYDETPFAAEVARHLGTRHDQFIVRPDAAADLPRLAEVFGEPFGDSSALPMHYLARETRRHVKVALSGDGGDELFGGYDRYRAMAAAERIASLPFPLPHLAGSRMWQWLPGVHPKSRLTKLKRFAEAVRLPAAQRYARFMRIYQPEDLARLYAPGLRLQTDERVIADEWFNAYHDQRDAVAAALALDRVTYLPGDLLTKVDRASMLHNLEVRSAFMDHELVGFASELEREELMGGGPKRLLREAFSADLPPRVFQRPKMGFAVPIGEWFRTSLRDMLHENLFAAESFARRHFDMDVVQRLIDEHQAARRDHGQRLYVLLMLELWQRSVGSSPANAV